MPLKTVLSDDILREVFDKLISVDTPKNSPQLLYKLALAGKQPMRVLREILDGVTECSVDRDLFFADLVCVWGFVLNDMSFRISRGTAMASASNTPITLIP